MSTDETGRPPTPVDHPMRRAEDTARFPRLTRAGRWVWAALRVVGARSRKVREVWYFLSSLIGLVAVIAAMSAVKEQTEGRRIASKTTCVAIGAVTKAGRAVIARSAAPITGVYAENLRRLGAPTPEERAALSAQARKEYGVRIATEIEQETGIPGIARPDGTIDCERLRQVTIDGDGR